MRRARRRCVRCGIPTNGGTYCPRHKASVRSLQLDWRARRRAAGRCLKCPEPRGNATHCTRHRIEHNLLSRLDLYRQGRGPLGDVANFCLTVLEYSALQLAGGKGDKRKAAANHYQIAMTVLNGVAMLSAKKGGPVARKADGRGDPFTKEETHFLEAAVTAFVRRAAERAADPNGNLPVITMADLPKLST